MTTSAAAVAVAVAAAVALSAAPAAAAPVVVELFTSQGCSSCPPADRLLSTWGAEQFARGRVLPLSFDVDYWDSLGWRDAFSAPAYSRRQAAYARALGVRTYTPQAVVAGRDALVGSDGEALAGAVARRAEEPSASRVRVSAAKSPASRVRLRVEASGGAGHAMLALFENGLRTDIAAGERAGESLRSDFVVRRLVDLGPLPLSRAVDEAWDPAWSKARGGAAVFVQDPATLAASSPAWVYPLERR
jgi:hypothetical protein